MDGDAGFSPKNPFLRTRGLRVPKHPEFTPAPVRRALRLDAYEAAECKAALKLVRNEDVILELGAGLGFLSALLSIKRDVRKIESYEGNPALLPYIAAMHEANEVQNVTAHNAVLGGRKSKGAEFHIRKNFLASSLSDDSAHGAVERVEKVEVLNANTVLKVLKPSMLICNIEGGEAELLQSMSYKGLRAAIITLHPQLIGANGVRDVFDAMHGLGLSYFAKRSSGRVVSFVNDW